MATKVNLLQLSPTMSEGRIVKWLVKEGDEVSSGQPIAEVETDKAVMEQESFEDGKVLKITQKEGAKVPVEALIMIIGEDGEDVSELLSEGGGGNKKEQAAEEKQDKQSDSGSKEKSSQRGGGRSSRERTQSPSASRQATGYGRGEKSAPRAEEGNGHGHPADGGRVIASPLARKMAQDEGLDIARIEGTGPRGRVIRRDIEKALREGVPASAPAAAGVSQAVVPTAVPEDEIEEVIELTGMRSTIARRLVESKQTVPHFQLSIEVRGEKLIDLQNRMREVHPDDKVSVTHLLIKAMASTLMRHKWVRGQWAGDSIKIVNAAHISVAVALEEGLVTPVLRNVEKLGVLEIARQTRELAKLARDRRLKPEQMAGGVQTISNLGMFGIHEFNAIINPPESTILAISAMEDRAIIENGKARAAKVMRITMSCDHRVVDGAVGARYLADLKQALEDPMFMLL